MKTFLFVWLIAFAVFAGLSIFGVYIDAWMNPFLREINSPRWWTMFTSHHGLTIAWFYFRTVFFLITAAVSGILALCVSFYSK